MKQLRAVLVLGGIAVSAALLAGAGWRALAASWADVLAAGPASLDQLAAAAAGTAVAGLAGWLAVGLLAATGSALCSAAGRGAGRTAGLLARAGRRVAPAAVHRLVGALLGAGLVLGTTGTALAAPAGSSGTPVAVATVATAQAAGDLDPTWSAGPAEHRPAAGNRLPGPRPRAPLGAEVVVRRGDTLWDLAARHLGPGAGPVRIAAEWPRWYAANRAVIGPDPDRLEPGQRLRVPDAGADS